MADPKTTTQRRGAAPAPKKSITVIPAPAKQAGGIGIGRILGVIVALILIGLIAYAVLPSSAVSPIGTGQTFTLASNQSAYFTSTQSQSTMVISVQSTSNGTATVLVGVVPVLSNPIDRFSLVSGGSVNVSSSGSGPADLHVMLVSASASSAQLKVTSIASSLYIVQSSSVSVTYPPAFTPSGLTPSNASGAQVSSTTAVTTTTKSSSGASTTLLTTLLSTTTTSSLPTAQVMADANASALGAIVFEYGTQWAADVGCNATTYNSTYHAVYGYAPVPPYDYYNESLIVPYSMTFAVAPSMGQTYLVTYTFHSHSSFSNRAGMTITVNLAATNPIMNITTKGYWAGLNYTTLNATYTRAVKQMNNCGVWIP